MAKTTKQKMLQRYALEGFPMLGATKSVKLLQAFGTVARVFTATEGQLAAGMGSAPGAKELREFLDAAYAP